MISISFPREAGRGGAEAGSGSRVHSACPRPAPAHAPSCPRVEDSPALAGAVGQAAGPGSRSVCGGELWPQFSLLFSTRWLVSDPRLVASTGRPRGPAQEVALSDRPRVPSLPLHTVISAEAAPQMEGPWRPRVAGVRSGCPDGPRSSSRREQNLDCHCTTVPPAWAPESHPQDCGSLGLRKNVGGEMGAGETLPWTGARERLWSQKASERPACGSCPALGPAPRPQQGAGRP